MNTYETLRHIASLGAYLGFGRDGPCDAERRVRAREARDREGAGSAALAQAIAKRARRAVRNAGAQA